MTDKDREKIMQHQGYIMDQRMRRSGPKSLPNPDDDSDEVILNDEEIGPHDPMAMILAVFNLPHSNFFPWASTVQTK